MATLDLFARATGDTGMPPINAPWPAKDVRFISIGKVEPTYTNKNQIAYVAIVGSVMLAAFLEWILWLAAFLYCLVKVFQKAESVSIRVLAVIIMVLFTSLR